MFNLKLPEETGGVPALPAANGRIIVSILESEPKPLAEDAPEGSEPPSTPENFFSVVVRTGNEVLERHDHLTMNPNVETAVADYAVTALEASEFVTIADISQSGQALSRRPANGSYEIAPPPYVARREHLARDMQGARNDKTGMQGILKWMKWR